MYVLPQTGIDCFKHTQLLISLPNSGTIRSFKRKESCSSIPFCNCASSEWLRLYKGNIAGLVFYFVRLVPSLGRPASSDHVRVHPLWLNLCHKLSNICHLTMREYSKFSVTCDTSCLNYDIWWFDSPVSLVTFVLFHVFCYSFDNVTILPLLSDWSSLLWQVSFNNISMFSHFCVNPWLKGII